MNAPTPEEWESLQRELAEAKHQLSETDSLLNACVRQHTLMEEQAGRLAGALAVAEPLAQGWVSYWTWAPQYGNGAPAPVHIAALKEIQETLAAWKEGRA